jgi:replicative superfamily II helicase
LGKDLLKDKDLSMVADKHMELIYQAAGHVYMVTNGKIVPTIDQLHCLAALEDQDILYIAATGSGKTLVIAMYLLVHPNTLSVTVCPLKELQRGQVRACPYLLDLPHSNFILA